MEKKSDTRSDFKQVLTSLNSEFYLSLTCCHNKVKVLSIIFYPVMER